MAFAAFTLQTDVSLSLGCFTSTGNDLAVHGQCDSTIVRFDSIVIPFPGWSNPLLARQASLPTTRVRAVGRHVRTMDGKDIPVTRCDSIGMPRFRIKHLNFNGTCKGCSGRRHRIRPDEHSGIAFWVKVFPLQFQHEVFIHPIGPHDSGWFAGGNNNSIANGECVGGNIYRHPAAQVETVEQRTKGFFGACAGAGHTKRESHRQGQWKKGGNEYGCSHARCRVESPFVRSKHSIVAPLFGHQVFRRRLRASPTRSN